MKHCQGNQRYNNDILCCMRVLPLADGKYDCGWLAWSEREQHEASCLLKPRPCRNGCGQMIPDMFIREHALNSCPKRAKPCSLGCGQVLNENDRLTHENSECARRCVPCPFWIALLCVLCSVMAVVATCAHRELMCECGRPFPWDGIALAHHRNTECDVVVVFCSNMCGERFTRKTMPEHLASGCKKRLTSCPLRCGAAEIYLDHVCDYVTAKVMFVAVIMTRLWCHLERMAPGGPSSQERLSAEANQVWLGLRAGNCCSRLGGSQDDEVRLCLTRNRDIC